VALDLKETLYRIAQEAMHNTIKHARATEIELRLESAAGELILELTDNGIGFDPSGSFPGHLGLQSMRERVAPFAGRLEIISSPGAGTRVRASIPASVALVTAS
jgi:signal transduction histidine kinase